ncbi:MAG TPA: hypothetical protein VMT42_04450 [candidate division Zixibacteria bacterium]|nr:hypothetical protein [candidate division Zixibacteria bacterium]
MELVKSVSHEMIVMDYWKTRLNNDLRDWLLSGEPWVIYRTLTDLLDIEESDGRVLKARKSVLEHRLIRKILDRRNDSGYWGVPKDIHTWWPRKDTTFWVLEILGDFGLRVEDEGLVKATEYVFSIQQKTGGFLGFDPKLPYDCHTAILTESLAKLTLIPDRRVQRAYDWLLGRQRRDGGWWCKNTGQVGGPREKEPSCAMATMFVLGAMAQDPRLRNSEVAKRGVDFLSECWENRGKLKYAGHDSQVGTDWEKLKYPFTDYKILKFLDVLSQFEYAKQRLEKSEMVDLLLSKRDSKGRFTPESIVKAWSDFDFGQKDKPSRWITLLALRIVKRICS